MYMKKTIGVILLAMLYVDGTYAGSSAIVNANNQISVNLLLQSQQINFGNQPNYFRMYDMRGVTRGIDIAIQKTFSKLYVKVDIAATAGELSYQQRAKALSGSTQAKQQISGRMGYSFHFAQNVSLTPYAMLGYRVTQVDTGGVDRNNNLLDGNTSFQYATPYGVGVLSQWSPASQWVLGADLTFWNNYHPWFYASIPLFSNGNVSTVYQQATLRSDLAWQLALNSDYAITPDLHLLLGMQYIDSSMSKGTTNILNLSIPSEKQHIWQYNAGLGYSLDALPSVSTVSLNSNEALVSANNLASISYGYLFQNYGEFSSTGSGYIDRQSGFMPTVSLAIAKTWKNIYGQIKLSEVIGNTRYIGSLLGSGAAFTASTRNTMTDLTARLGYQFMMPHQYSITPYGVFGYHRWLRSVSGIPYGPFLLDAYPETYQNNWYGLGGLFQWAPTTSLVLSMDFNTGRTSNPRVHEWNSFFSPSTIFLTNSLGSRSYQKFDMGGDYQFAKKWHLLANVDYWRFYYEQSQATSFGVYEPTSSTHLLRATIGVGYSLT